MHPGSFCVPMWKRTKKEQGKGWKWWTLRLLVVDIFKARIFKNLFFSHIVSITRHYTRAYYYSPIKFDNIDVALCYVPRLFFHSKVCHLFIARKNVYVHGKNPSWLDRLEISPTKQWIKNSRFINSVVWINILFENKNQILLIGNGFLSFFTFMRQFIMISLRDNFMGKYNFVIIFLKIASGHLIIHPFI